MNNLQMLKLVTGEAIIADLSTKDDDNYLLSKPLQILVQPTPQGMGVSLIPWMSQNVNIKESAIIAFSSPPTEIEKEYIKFTTNISLETGNFQLNQ